MATWLLIAALAALLAAMAATPAVLLLRYRLQDGHQAVRVELVLFYGLWRRHWRIPGRRRHSARTPGDRRFSARVARITVPGPAPARRPVPGWRSPASRALAYLRGRVEVRGLRLRLVVGAGDPALSAMAVGVVLALAGSAWALLPAYFRVPAGFHPMVRADPDYRRARLDGRLECIAATRFGHLTVAVLLALSQRGRAALASRRR